MQKFKVGDKVRVASEATSENTKRVPGEFENSWYAAGMEEFLGGEYTIRSADFTGIRFEEGGSYGFPPAMLTMVSEAEKAEEKEEVINFQVGQTVYCLMNGKGVVEQVKETVYSDHPVVVTFNNGVDEEYSETYTIGGKFMERCKRTLFFSEPKVEAAEKPPFESKLVGKKVAYAESYHQQGELSEGVVVRETEDWLEFEEQYGFSKSGLRKLYVLEEVAI